MAPTHGELYTGTTKGAVQRITFAEYKMPRAQFRKFALTIWSIMGLVMLAFLAVGLVEALVQ